MNTRRGSSDVSVLPPQKSFGVHNTNINQIQYQGLFTSNSPISIWRRKISILGCQQYYGQCNNKIQRPHRKHNFPSNPCVLGADIVDDASSVDGFYGGADFVHGESC